MNCYCPKAPAEVSYLAGHHWNLFLSADGTVYAFDNKGEALEYDILDDTFNLKVNLRDIFLALFNYFGFEGGFAVLRNVNPHGAVTRIDCLLFVAVPVVIRVGTLRFLIYRVQ